MTPPAAGKPIILHLTDLHFGCDRGISEETARQLALKGLLNVLGDCELDWKPNMVCVSGDIGWRGQAADYQGAETWLRELLETLNVTPEQVFLCAGNHDINRGVSTKYARPPRAAEADTVLGVPIEGYLEDAFQAFTGFANGLGIPPYQFGDTQSYLVGERRTAQISVVAINSSWFCKGDDDKGKLWIGRPQIDFLESHGQLAHPDEAAILIPTIVLIHHPKECLHEEEIHETGNRPATFISLARRCHLMLSGHAHPRLREADRHAERAWQMNGSAAYAGDLYYNGFSLIQVHHDKFVYRQFEYEPRSRKWPQVGGPGCLPFRDGAPSAEQPTAGSFGLLKLEACRRAALSHAEKVIEAKSRALKPWGNLPATLPLHVRLDVHGVRPRFSAGELLMKESEVQTTTLFEATRTSRQTLLLGDLGSGKSTMAAAYVIEALRAVPNSLALFVPATSLLTPDSPAHWRTVKDFLRAIAAYFSGHIAPEQPHLDLEVLLSSRVELLVVVDSLDEVHPDHARAILQQLAEVADHWASNQVLATGRPVELIGLNYARWQICTTAPLSDEEKLSFFTAEAAADGDGEHEAHAAGSAALKALQSLPDIHSLAVTPLFCRLLFKRLRQYPSDATLTLGDLLYELMLERLAVWSERDSKGSSTELFDSLYPTANSRAALLGQVALRFYPTLSRPIEEARRHLESLLARSDKASAAALVEEALRSFEHSGLVTLEGGFQFTLQPFVEFLCGYGRVLAAAEDPEHSMPSDVQQWRAASFAATAARRLGVAESLRAAVMRFVHRLLSEGHNVPAASYIISELRDSASATAYIDELELLGRRPLWFSFDSAGWELSARAIAGSLKLAGDRGFNWFFTQYLDPRYPYVFTGSGVTDKIFEQWAGLSLQSLSEDERKSLGSLVTPHMAAQSHQLVTIIPFLAVLVPEAFEKDHRLGFCAQLLSTEPFRTPAEAQLRAAASSGDSATVNGSLIAAAQTGYEYAKAAASLHLSLFDARPPMAIIRALFRAQPGRGLERTHRQGFEALAGRLDANCIERLLRWLLFDPDTMVAAGAAIELHRLGEWRLALLGAAILGALHDGSYVALAEEGLDAMVKRDGHRAVRWLASSVAEGPHQLPRSHSGWWRILLGNLASAGSEGPALLAGCVAGIGEFLLARYPEVRQEFRELLAGGDGAAFRGALRDCLSHSDPAVRHGASMVLTATGPTEEPMAAEEVVRCKSRERYGAWHEWEQFCLSLAFGPSVVAHLRSKLPTFPPDAEVFALAILYRNGVKLEASELQRLIHGELNWVLASDDSGQASQSDAALPILLEIVQGDAPDVAQRAAEILLRRHAGRLSDDQRAVCTALTSEAPWHRSKLQGELRRMLEDATYAESISRNAAVLVQEGFPPPLIDLLYRAWNDPKVWEDLVWSELCSGWPAGGDVDEHGQWILDFMREFPANAEHIGAAARKFVFDVRLTPPPNPPDAIHWLALLAHEAGALSKEEMERIVVGHTHIHSGAFVALLARLGTVPPSLRPARRVGMPAFAPAPMRVPLPVSPLEALRECARPSESLHPDLCPKIEDSLFQDPLCQDDLASLARSSQNGGLVACALATVYGKMPDADWVLGAYGYYPSPMPQDHCLTRLVAMWRCIRFASLDNAEWRGAYTNGLSQALHSGSGEILAFASQLLEIRGSLTPAEVGVVFTQLTRRVFDDEGVTARLSSWLSGDVITEVQTAVDQGVEIGLSTLDAQPWHSDGSLAREAGPFLLLPLLRWKMRGQSDDRSKRVFLRGLRIALVPERVEARRERRWEAIQDIHPLMSAVPRSFLHEAIRYAEFVQDPVTRDLCRIFVLNPTERLDN